MSVLNAGLPNNTSAPNLPIGAQMLLVPTAQLLNFSDGSVWLQSGNGVTPSSYPDAAKLDHVCTHGAAANLTAAAAFSTTTQVASDGNGIVIATRGATNQVLRSTDYGATWATVSITALTNSPLLTSVVWTGSRFIVGGTITGTTTAAWAHSTDGSSWTAGTADTTLSSVNSDAMSMAVNPSTGTVIAVLGNNSSTGQSIQRCTTGSTFSRIASAPTNSSMACAVAYGNGYFVAVYGSGSSQATYYSTDDGATWSAGGSITLASTNANVAYINGVFVASANAAGQVHYTATNPTTWTQRSIGAVSPGSSSMTTFNYGAGIASDGARLVVCGGGGSGNNSFFWATSDGINWRKRHIATNGAPWKPAFAGRGVLLFLPSTGLTSYNRTASIVTPDFVGVPYTVGAQGSFDTNTVVLYTRIK